MLEGAERARFRKPLLRRIHPMMIEDMARTISPKNSDPIGILILASFLRDDFPWLYEIGLDAYRAARGLNPRLAEQALRRFRDAAEMTLRGPWAEELVQNRESHMMLRELSEVIDHLIHVTMERVMRRRRELGEGNPPE